MSSQFGAEGMWEYRRQIGTALRNVIGELDKEGLSLVVSAFGRGGGGLGVVEIEGVDVLDRISTKGIDCDGSIFARVIDLIGGVRSGPLWGEIALYDSNGLVRHERHDGIGDLHDVVIDGDSLVVVSTASEQVIRVNYDQIRPSLDVMFETGSGSDLGHLNCLSRGDSPLAVSAFQFGSLHSWRSKENSDSSDQGVVIEIESGRSIVSGLCKPHSPRRWRNNWVIADAGNSCITIVEENGDRHSIDCGGFTRALHLHGDFAFVGVAPLRVSANEKLSSSQQFRNNELPGMSRVLLVDLLNHEVIDEIELPFVEVYDLLVIPRSMVDGLRIGAATSALRLLERAAIERLWPERSDSVAIDAIPLPDRVSSINVTGDGPFVAGGSSVIHVAITNLGQTTLASVGPNRVLLGWRWGQAGADGGGSCGLTAPIAPGQTISIPCPVEMPLRSGMHRLVVGLIQEGVGPVGDAVVHAVPIEGTS